MKTKNKLKKSVPFFLALFSIGFILLSTINAGVEAKGYIQIENTDTLIESGRNGALADVVLSLEEMLTCAFKKEKEGIISSYSTSSLYLVPVTKESIITTNATDEDNV